MRHRRSGKRLGVAPNRRRAMERQLVEALFLHGRIQTTLTRAKAVQPIAEHVITWAKRGELHHRRMALALIHRVDVVNRIFDQIVEWYRQRQGGYTRVIKIGPRAGDAAMMAYLELVDWVSGATLPGQHTKSLPKPTDEQGTESGEKSKKEKVKPKKVQPKTKVQAPKERTAKDPEKEKKITENKAKQEKAKKDKAEHRAKTKQAKHTAKSETKHAAKSEAKHEVKHEAKHEAKGSHPKPHPKAKPERSGKDKPKK